MAHEFIDLGLPSGTLWPTKNEPGYHRPFGFSVRLCKQA